MNERVEYVFSEKIDSEDDEEVAREQSEIEVITYKFLKTQFKRPFPRNILIFYDILCPNQSKT